MAVAFEFTSSIVDGGFTRSHDNKWMQSNSAEWMRQNQRRSDDWAVRDLQSQLLPRLNFLIN